MAFLLLGQPALLIAPLLPLAQDTIRVGSTTIELRTEVGVPPDAAPRHSYRIKREDGEWGTTYEASHFVHLRYEQEDGKPAVFDPRDGAPREPDGTFSPPPPDSPPPPESRLVLVQYHTHPLPEYRQQFAGAPRGVRPVRLLSGNTEIVVVEDAAARDWLQAQQSQTGFVRSIRPYRPEYRLEPNILVGIRNQTLERMTYVIEVLDSGHAMKGQVLAEILKLGGIVEQTPPSGMLLRATLTPSQLERVATWTEVISLEIYSKPRAHAFKPTSPGTAPVPLDLVRKDGGADYLEWKHIDGTGIKVEVMDTGFFEGHTDLPPVILNETTDPYKLKHGTSVLGIMGALLTEAGGEARGVFQNGTLVFSTIYGVMNRAEHTRNLVLDGCVLQTNSWGLKEAGYGYSSTTFDLDTIAFDNDLLIVQSMGTTAEEKPDEAALAKNVLSIGGVAHKHLPAADHEPVDVGTNDYGEDNLSGIEGPKCVEATPDVHIKPDLCYWHDMIWTTTSVDVDPITSAEVSSWGNFSGTSASAPSVAGHAGLVYALWHEGVFGHVDSVPHPTTVRALLINSAQRYEIHKIARHEQGWGRPDLQTLYKRREVTFVIDESDDVVLKEAESARWKGPLDDCADGLRVTMVYRDPPSTSSDGPTTLHHDLTLKVIAPDGTPIFWGNHGLCLSNESFPGGENDAYNPIENVFLKKATAESHGLGDWEVIVHALKVALPYPAVPGDPVVVPETRFALVITGLTDPVRVE